MPARAALPVLLLALFALPAHADYIPRGSDLYYCLKKEEGDPCGKTGSGTCREATCVNGGGDERPVLEYDCLKCMSQETYQEHQVQTLLHRAPWALAVSCLITLTWYQMRRKPMPSSGQSGPSGSEPPSPPTV